MPRVSWVNPGIIVQKIKQFVCLFVCLFGIASPQVGLPGPADIVDRSLTCSSCVLIEYLDK